MFDSDRALGAVLGAAVGDALGTPIESLSHQNVRTYYKGIKGYRADEKRGDREAGEGTHRTVRLGALARALAASSERPLAERFQAALSGQDLPRWQEAAGVLPAASLAAAAAPLGVWADRRGASEADLLGAVQEVAAVAGYRHANALAAAYGQAAAVRDLLRLQPERLEGPAFVEHLAGMTARAEEVFGADASCSRRLRALAPTLDEYPLDLQDRCAGTGPAADASWPFAVAMVARNPTLLEATLLSAVNVGGDAPTIGACSGALMGALHGWEAFPADWREGLAARDALAGSMGKA